MQKQTDCDCLSKENRSETMRVLTGPGLSTEEFRGQLTLFEAPYLRVVRGSASVPERITTGVGAPKVRQPSSAPRLIIKRKQQLVGSSRITHRWLRALSSETEVRARDFLNPDPNPAA